MPKWTNILMWAVAVVVGVGVAKYMPRPEHPTSPAGLFMSVGLPLLFLGILAWSVYFNPKRMAKKLVDEAKAIYVGDMEFAVVSPGEFPWLDHAYYDEVARQMEAAGCRCLGDIECLTVSRQYPGMRTFLRVFISDDGAVMAAAYHVRVRGFGLMRLFTLLRLMPGSIKTIDMETEFSDHTFLAGTQGPLAAKCPDFPGIDRRIADPATPVGEMLANHRQAVEQKCRESGVEPKTHRTLEEVLVSQNRMQAIKSAHKKKTGYITREQMERVAGRPLNEAEELLAHEVEKAQNGK